MRLFIVLATIISVTSAQTVSCRDRKAGTRVCNPYDTSFLKADTGNKADKALRHKPVTERKSSAVQKLKLNHSLSLQNLIDKYIKREERLYKKVEQKQVKENSKVILQKVSEEPKKQKILKQEKFNKIIPPKKEEQAKRAKPKNPIVNAEKIVEKRQIETKEIKVKIVKQKPEELTKIVVLAKQPKTLTNLSSNSDDLSVDKSVKQEIKTLRPKKLEPVRAEQIAKKVKINTEEYALYKVKKGDSLIAIARKFSVSLDKVIEINHLEDKHMLKVGQKLRIPLSKEKMNAIDIAFYVVKKGDSLSSIARKFNVKISDLKKYNKIKKKAIIHVGQGLILPVPHKIAEIKRIEEKKKKARLRKKRERERLARIALKKRERARFLKLSKGLKHKLSVTATAYTSHYSQTDGTPFLAAWNNRIRPGMKIIAVSRDLIYKYGITNGKKVRISGLPGIYTVRDKMNKKWRKKIDIYMGTSRWRALQWGRRRVTLYY